MISGTMDHIIAPPDPRGHPRMNATQPVETGAADRLDLAARRLMDLIGAAAPGLACTLLLTPLPPSASAAEGITLLLRRLVPLGRLRDASAALALRADFLITASTADPLAGLRALGEIAMAAMAEPDYEVASPEIQDSGLLVSMRVLRPRDKQEAKRVRSPMHAKIEPTQIIRGMLVNAAGSNLPHVPLALQGSNESTSTDSAGKFQIAAPGQGAAGIEAEISGRRQPIAATADSNVFVTKSEE